MYSRLFFVKIAIASLLCYCGCYRTNQQRAEYLVVDNFKGNKGDGGGAEIPVRRFMEELPIAVVVELKEPLLESLRRLWMKENETTFPINRILLGTFDSKGLQHRSVYNETSEFLRAVWDLKAPVTDEENLSPTMHILNELLQENLSDGSIVLVTTTKPSDEDYTEVLVESLMRRKCQLSVLWKGDTTTNDYNQLKDLAGRTGGKFGFILDEFSREIEVPESKVYQEFENVENISSRIRFPEQKLPETSENTQLISRASDQKFWQKVSIPLIVEVASGTSLEIRPGTPTHIPFTVKNNLNGPVNVYFRAKFNDIIQQVQPQHTFLQPSAKATVLVNLQPQGISQAIASGTVTLIASVGDKITARSALVSLSSQTVTDKTDPKMDYKYEGDCSNYREPHNCENGLWGLEATVVDEDSGLLKILSEPYGLLFQSEFVAGTKSPVKVFYGATCCQPTVHIWAEDLRGNYVKKSFDVFNQTLLAGEIAGIVLGVLLLIFIIIAIIVAVVLYRRRNQRNMIIPRARSGSR